MGFLLDVTVPIHGTEQAEKKLQGKGTVHYKRALEGLKLRYSLPNLRER